MVALILFLHIAQRIHSTAFVEFVDDNYISIVEHINLFKLCGGTVFRCHHVHAHVAIVCYLRIALADARCFEDNQIIVSSFQNVHRIPDVFRYCQIALTGSHRTHEHAWVANGIHTNTIAQQCTTCFLLGRVYRYDTYILVFEIYQEAAYQLINKRAFTCTTCTRNTKHRRFRCRSFFFYLFEHCLCFRQLVIVFCSRYKTSYRFSIFIYQMPYFAIQLIAGREIASFNQVVYHTLQAHRTSVIRRVNARDTISMQLVNFCWQNNTTTTTKYLDVSAVTFLQQVVHILEVFYVAALVRCHGNCICIFLYSTIYYSHVLCVDT
eukprot:Opistho-1_new@85052